MMSRSKYRSTVEICADCGAPDPTWASINRGLLLCAECCSVHRSMGRHISHVKSLRHGTWPPSLLAMIQTATAQNVNCVWEHSLLDTSAPKHLRKKPQPKDPLHPTKWEFIQCKHLRLAFVLRGRRDETATDRGRQLHAAVRSSSLDTALRLLVQGADPNYYHPEKGSTCLHAASRAGQAAQAELLVAWGALPSARDLNHATPADTASAAGHSALGLRLRELALEAVDRLSAHLTGSRPQRTGHRTLELPPPRAPQPRSITDGAKAARSKLQLLPNHLFEELVMDIYDEVDRRETEAIWALEASAGGSGLERCGVAFLPVNPALSAPRNQGRQKLARLSSSELADLVRDALGDAARRQHLASLRPLAAAAAAAATAAAAAACGPGDDDEPLYDSVASDDECAPDQLRHHMSNGVGRTGRAEEVSALRRELEARDCTIGALRLQLRALQGVVERLTQGEDALNPPTPAPDQAKGARGRSLAAEPTPAPAATPMSAPAPPAAPMRPVSMFETTERTQHDRDCQLRQKPSPLPVAAAAAPAPEPAAVDPAAVCSAAEALSRAMAALWAAARDHPHGPLPDVQPALAQLLALFPTPYPDVAVTAVLENLREGYEALKAACASASASASLPDSEAASPPPLHAVREAAYLLARATKDLVTHFQPQEPV